MPNSNPHFILIPLMAQGHMLPMSDLALLLARRGVRATLVTTPINSLRLQSLSDLASSSNLPLQILPLPFPCSDANLPEGCENVDLIPSPNLYIPFFNSLHLLSSPLKSFLQSQPFSATCIISDQCMPWTKRLSKELNIPRFVFHGPSAFYLVCTIKLSQHNLYQKVEDCEEVFVVPDLPHKIEASKVTAQRFFDWPGMEEIRRDMEESDDVADGFVLNTFRELEPWYVEEFGRAVRKPVWAVGPVSVAVKGDGRGGVGNGAVLGWLDGRDVGSVVFVSFGSLARIRKRQIVEIGSGLEGSGFGFVWAVKEAEESEETRGWLGEFEERNRGRGVILRGWVPQVMILRHSAVGGFMTHCGWNSTIEGVAAGLPMVTWPHFADQFLNEKLVVEVLRTGVGVGVKLPWFYQGMSEEVVVGRETVEMAVRRVMCDEEMRKRAREIGVSGRRAMEEGGSSYEDLSSLIDCATKLALDCVNKI